MRVRALLLVGCILFLFGCQKTEQLITTSGTITEEAKIKKETALEVDLRKFFKPDKSIAKFLGGGNEFATYTEKTTWLSEKYVGTIVDNGGSILMNVYKINADIVDLIYREQVDVYPPDLASFPKLEDLQRAKPIETYLAKPIKVGTTFSNWTIVDMNVTVETPYKTFENVFVIEEVGEKYVNRKYFAEGFGEIKSEFIMDSDDGGKFIVTSTLESLEVK